MKPVTKKVLAYAIMPQIKPRVRELFSGFTFLSFSLAQVYRSVGLLPAGHPYLLPANRGRFGVTQVITEAGLLLKKRKSPFDQVAVYWLLMISLVVLGAQVLLVFLGGFIQTAHAAIGPGTNFFTRTTAQNTSDLAFMLMDRVFGVPNLFNSCVSAGTKCFPNDLLKAGEYWTTSQTGTGAPTNTVTFPYPYHLAMHSMMQLYSTALLVIGAIILCYFIGAVILETAESGTPFGRRFNRVWAPIRLVMAMGLLIPIANGLNAAQYITLYAAKFGSNFASNGWDTFTAAATTGGNTLLGAPNSLVANVNAPPISTLMTFFALVGTCKQGLEAISKDRGDKTPVDIEPYLVNPSNTAQPFINLNSAGWNFAQAVKFYGRSTIVVRFGDHAMDTPPTGFAAGGPSDIVYSDAISNVEPLCGEVVLPMTNADQTATPGAWFVLQEYYEVVLASLWADATTAGADPLYLTGKSYTQIDLGLPAPNPSAPLPTINDMVTRANQYLASVQTIVTMGQTQQQAAPALTGALGAYGWGGAGLWYNQIAQVNGSYVSAVYDIPAVSKMPEVMEQIEQANEANNQDTTGLNRFRPYLSGGHEFDPHHKYDGKMGLALQHAYDRWSDAFSDQNVSGNVFIDAINAVFGSGDLFNIRQNASATPPIHPLAQLTALGAAIKESAIRNLGFAAFAGIGGGVANILGPHLVGTVALAVSSFLVSIAMASLSIGFILYYVLPFLPFVYFFFAVCGWIKGIFEAMVGVPLWALAHLRIDSEGLPGDVAMGGYYLILEIFLRPFLIIFGMLGGLAIYSAQAKILNDVWPLVTSNLAGFNVADASKAATPDSTGAIRFLRSAVDQMFFTVIYAIVLYMLGMSSFKMVNLVPNYILRWLGANVHSFGEESGDAAEGLIGNVFMESNQVLGQAQGAINTASGALGQTARNIAGRAGG